MKIPNSRAGFLQALLEEEPPPARKPPEPPKPPAPPRTRFEALQNLAIKPEALATLPVKPAQISAAPAYPSIWESLREKWSNPKPGSAVDILVSGVKHRQDLPARPQIRDAIVGDIDLMLNSHLTSAPFDGQPYLDMAYSNALELRARLEAMLAEGEISTREYTLMASMLDGLLVDLKLKQAD